MTLYGEFMAVVPAKKQPFVVQLAKERNLPPKVIVGQLLEQAISWNEIPGHHEDFRQG